MLILKFKEEKYQEHTHTAKAFAYESRVGWESWFYHLGIGLSILQRSSFPDYKIKHKIK
jgi:hypothetical protein